MARESFNFREALDELKYLQSINGTAESLLQKIVSKIKEYNIPVVSIGEIFICAKKYSFGVESYRIHVTYTQRGGDFKQRIYDKEGLPWNYAVATMDRVEDYLLQEKYKPIDITEQSKEKDKDIIKMLKFEI